MELRRNGVTSSVRTEGSLLPADLLGKIIAADRSVPGLEPADFGLPAGERTREAITSSWNRLVGAWAALGATRVGAGEGDALIGATRERFLLPLFEELGFGRVGVARAIEIEGRSYPISHTWANQAGSVSVPIHLVGYGVELDSRSKGVRGAAGAAPHAMLQEYLNRADDALWGLLSNGRTLRLLRDSTSLTRAAYVEFDLESIFEGELYADFALLWTTCHRSRFDGERPAECLLEQWTKKAADDGTRALDRLRMGVEKAIEALGSGFLSHPDNRELREALRSGDLDRQDYYRELLRLVYRLIFLFTAEDRRDERGRELLLAPDASDEAVERYRASYSTARLRSFAARKRGTRHHDLWVVLRRVIAALGTDGAPSVALPALGSFLFGNSACEHLDQSSLRNEDLLRAVRALTTVEEDRRLRAVDYRNLGAEELGSVYEGLLELHPRIEMDANPPRFELSSAAGNERKSTGSYYTPSTLISCLLDSALEPVVDAAVRGKKGPDAEAALLALAVVDPAAGSGHFLVAASHRLAKRLASIRSEETEPTPSAIRHALRDVIARCIYAVDINPMAVELCKVSLWLEALEPGRPLSFLDAHIKCGNSLLGTTPELAGVGIPDAAYEALNGDDKAVVRRWRKQNADEVRGQQSLFEAPLVLPTNVLAAEAQAVDALPDETATAIAEKAARHRAFEASSDYRRSRLALDAWCAAFVVPKRSEHDLEVTTSVVRALGTNPSGVPARLGETVAATAAEYGFFHWPVEFPGVFARGGFDVVVGNPPWGQIELKETEFFATARPDIAGAVGSARRRLLDQLPVADPLLHSRWQASLRRLEGERKLIADSGVFPLTSGGRQNLYALFAERMRGQVRGSGRIGAVLQSGIATDDSTKEFFADLVERSSLISLYDFENRKGLFPTVHREQRFCLITLAGADQPSPVAEFVFLAQEIAELSEPARMVRLSPEDLRLINPNTLTCPVIRSASEAELVKSIYRRIPVLVSETSPADTGSWPVYFRQGMFNMTTDAGRFKNHDQLIEGHTLEGDTFQGKKTRFIPLLEGKLTEAYNHRYATFAGVPKAEIEKGYPRESVPAELQQKDYRILPRYWVDAADVEDNDWLSAGLLTFHRVANPNNEDTAVFTVVPPVGIGDSLFLMLGMEEAPSLALCVLGNSFIFDYLVRVKGGSRNLSFFVVKQLPVPSQSAVRAWARQILPAALELTYTSEDLRSFAQRVGWTGDPFGWNPQRRQSLRIELEAICFHLYGLSREEVGFVMDRFPITRRLDEERYGEYRTKRLILERFDAVTEAAAAGVEYRMAVDPPPGDMRVAASADAPGSWRPLGEVWAPESPTPPRMKSEARQGDLRTPPAPSTAHAQPGPAQGKSTWLAEAAIEPATLVVATPVRHRDFGEGTLLSVETNGKSAQVLIRFERSGERWIALGFGLLEFDAS